MTKEVKEIKKPHYVDNKVFLAMMEWKDEVNELNLKVIRYPHSRIYRRMFL